MELTMWVIVNFGIGSHTPCFSLNTDYNLYRLAPYLYLRCKEKINCRLYKLRLVKCTKYTRNTIRFISVAGGWDGIYASGVITQQFLNQLVIQTGFTARQIQVSIVEKDGIIYLILDNGSVALCNFNILVLWTVLFVEESVCHFYILVLWTVLFVEVEYTLYRLQMRGNIIIALECVQFWLPQVPSFHKLFKSLPPTNKEKVLAEKRCAFHLRTWKMSVFMYS